MGKKKKLKKATARFASKYTWGGRGYYPNQQVPRVHGLPLQQLVTLFLKKNDLRGVRRILPSLLGTGVLDDNKDIAAMVVELFGKNGCLEDAKRVFDSIHKPHYICWHFIVQAYVIAGEIDTARQIYNKINRTFSNMATRTLLIGGYINHNRLRDAWAFYRAIKEPDFVAWAIMFTAFLKRDHLTHANKMLEKMPRRIDIAWNVVLQAYCKKGQLEKAKEVFDAMPERNILSYRMLGTTYARTGHIVEARNLVQSMPDVDSLLWNELIEAYAQRGQMAAAASMLAQLRARSNPAAITAVMHGFGRQGNVAAAETLYPMLHPPDLLAHNTMLTVYARNGHLKEACNIFKEMPKRDIVSWSNMIQGYAQHNQVEQAEKLFAASKFYCAFAATAIMAAYTRAGQMKEANRLFKRLLHPIPAAWSAMIGGYAQRGLSRRSFDFFRKMNQQGIAPDGFTFTALFAACDTLDGARDCFRSMESDYSIPPRLEQYHCLIDSLGKAARLDEAENLLNSMPIVPDAAAWWRLWHACGVHGDGRRAKRIAKIVEPPEKELESPYILLLDRHAFSYREDKPRDQRPLDYGMPMGRLFQTWSNRI